MQYCYFQVCLISNFYTLSYYLIFLSLCRSETIWTAHWPITGTVSYKWTHCFTERGSALSPAGSSSEAGCSLMLSFCSGCGFKGILSACTLQRTDLIQKLIALTLTCFNKPKVSINHFFSHCTFPAALLIYFNWTDK